MGNHHQWVCLEGDVLKLLKCLLNNLLLFVFRFSGFHFDPEIIAVDMKPCNSSF
jgi:hypothetical protein